MMLSFRNVTVKQIQRRKPTMSTLHSIGKFLEITSAEGIISCLQLLLTLNNFPTLLKMITTCKHYGFEAIVFHGLYNLASITVLGLISAPSHSLLNVGKRISNVLVASIVFKEKIDQKGIIGLAIASVGGVSYIFDLNTICFTKKRNGGARLLLLVGPLLLLLISFAPAKVAPSRDGKETLLCPRDPDDHEGSRLNEMFHCVERRQQSQQCIQDIIEHLINLFGPFISPLNHHCLSTLPITATLEITCWLMEKCAFCTR